MITKKRLLIYIIACFILLSSITSFTIYTMIEFHNPNHAFALSFLSIAWYQLSVIFIKYKNYNDFSKYNDVDLYFIISDFIKRSFRK